MKANDKTGIAMPVMVTDHKKKNNSQNLSLVMVGS